MHRWLLGKRGADSASTLSSEPDCVTTTKRKTRCKYSEEYLSSGFTSVGPDDNPTPVCVLCSETLANKALKPRKLWHHLETKHGSFASKPWEFFDNKLKDYQNRKKIIDLCDRWRKRKGSGRIVWGIKTDINIWKGTHTIGEDLILPAAKQMFSIMPGKNAVKQLNLILLSNNTVRSRIDDMAENVFQ